jgi:hypothetical protein
LEDCVAVTDAVPDPTGVTVTTWVLPHPVKVALLGLTVATELSLEASAMVNEPPPGSKLQPLSPSPFLGCTNSVVVPSVPPTFSDISSAVASIDASRLLEISSAAAVPARPNVVATTSAATTAVRVRVTMRCMSKSPRVMWPWSPRTTRSFWVRVG